jgi:hypothetical protein
MERPRTTPEVSEAEHKAPTCTLGAHSQKENDRRNTISITLYDLPSSESGKQEDWTHSMDGMDIVNFMMDPSQDLLVLVALAPQEYVR